MTFLFWFCFLLYIAASAVLIFVVLVQSGKGGGLSGLVGSGTVIGDHLGTTGAEKTLNRWTTYCAVGFLVINILLVMLGGAIFKKSILTEVQEITTETGQVPTEVNAPAAPQGTPSAVPEAGAPVPPAAESAAAPVTAPEAPAPPQTDAAPLAPPEAEPPAAPEAGTPSQ